MIDHIGLHVRDVARATEFYLKALSPLGYGIVMQVSAEETGHGAAVGFGAGQKPSFWIAEGEPKSGPMHIAFVAPSRAAVDTFYQAAMKAGGKDNGPPGLRPEYHANYYGAFVFQTATTPRRCVTCRSEGLDQPPRQFGSENEQGFGCSTGIFSWVLGSVFVS
jgi:catechol 2,3-dioxygenase-like lactoylglutathione lyase family enzyme